jgi:hypothetical protein
VGKIHAITRRFASTGRVTNVTDGSFSSEQLIEMLAMYIFPVGGPEAEIVTCDRSASEVTVVQYDGNVPLFEIRIFGATDDLEMGFRLVEIYNHVPDVTRLHLALHQLAGHEQPDWLLKRPEEYVAEIRDHTRSR